VNHSLPLNPDQIASFRTDGPARRVGRVGFDPIAGPIHLINDGDKELGMRHPHHAAAALPHGVELP